MLLTETIGERIVSKASAETLGSVDGVVIDVAERTISGLRVGKGKKAKIIPWSAISGVGDAAVVVEGEDVLRVPDEGTEEQQARGDITLIGGLVLSDLGNEYGKVTDVEYDEQTGAIHTIRCAQPDPIAVERLRAIGTYAWVVAAADDEA